MTTLRRLGTTEIEISPIGLGCWQFSEGFGLVGGYWAALPAETVREIVRASLAGGINWFDTAEAYGGGRSERALAGALGARGVQSGEVVIATKWWPLLRTARSVEKTLDRRVAALSPYPIDLHQVHQPMGFSSVEAEMAGMATLVATRRIRAVGISNFNASRTRRAHAALSALGVPLASNQVKYSLLDRRIERNGVLAAAKELGVTIIAYSPLEQGLLSGKFHDDPDLIRKSPGPRKWLTSFRATGLARSRPLIEELRKIGEAHGASASQVALAWLITFSGKTVVAIPGASRPSHVEENVGAMDLALSPLELRRIDELSRHF